VSALEQRESLATMKDVTMRGLRVELRDERVSLRGGRQDNGKTWNKPSKDALAVKRLNVHSFVLKGGDVAMTCL
jgi:hypothetical protein